jgi:hypothetical protein
MTKSIYTFQMPLGALLLTITAKDITQSDDIVWYTPKPTLVQITIHAMEQRVYQAVVAMPRPWDDATVWEAAEFIVQRWWSLAELEEVQ